MATYFFTFFTPDMAQGHRVGIVNGLRFGLIDEVVGFWPLSLSLRSAGSSMHSFISGRPYPISWAPSLLAITMPE